MKKFIFVLLILTLLIIPTRTEAVCTREDMNTSINDAYKMDFSFVLKFADNDKMRPYYEITATGLTKNISFKHASTVYNYGDNINNPSTIVFSEVEEEMFGKLLYIDIIASKNTNCFPEIVYTKQFRLPTYNKYYGREECAEYPEFKFCKKDYAESELTEEEFLTALNKYIEEQKDKPDIENENNEKSIFQKIIDIYLDNKVISIPITTIIILGLTAIIIIKVRRKKKRVKIDLGGNI